MPAELLSPIVAFTGVIISILASVLISARQTKIEVKKLRTELQKTYASKLLDKRIETYPILFRFLSGFSKDTLESENFTKAKVDKLIKDISEWDTSHSIFMSGNAVRKYSRFRSFLRSIAKMPESEFAQKFIDAESRLPIIKEFRKLEKALKQDLGVYVVEFPEADTSEAMFMDDYELIEKYKK